MAILKHTVVFVGGLAAICAASGPPYDVDPPTTAPSDTISDCTNWAIAASSDTCQSLAAQGDDITVQQFLNYNPSLQNGCHIIVGESYCIEENYGIPPATTSSTSTTSRVSSSTGDGVSTPSPIQTGMATNCNKFYLVQSGDSCQPIANSFGISLSQFYAWNPAVGSSCGSLDVGDYVCVGILGLTTSTTSSHSTNGISTPQPIQTGMTTSCNRFYDVVSGDTCTAVANAYGITLSQFYAWNPAVGSSCSNLDVGDYVCVGIIGQTMLTTTTSTSKGNGVSTPSPIQTGMTTSCNKFYDVASGDTCQAVADKFSVSLSQFYSWNPAVGSSCANLDVGDYVCVGVIGFTATTTTTKTTSTTTGNGVSTPTPTQPGIVNNCNKFHYVVSGDTCQSIATAAGISVANFEAWNGQTSSCSGLWLNTYSCIGIL